jgi:hypothetical protein
MALVQRTIELHRAVRAGLVAVLALTALGAAPSAWSACVDAGGGATTRGAGPGVPDVPGAIGIIDTLTEFASLCVNGLEIHYDDGTPVTINGRPASVKQLALGQVVAVEAQSTPGRLAAQSIAILRVLEGPVTGIDAPAQTVFVMGQAVRVTDQTRALVRGQDLEAIKPGATVQVSGYRNARGEIVASRLDVAPPGEHSAIGRMRRLDARSGEIRGLPVSLASARAQGDGDVLVRGRWDGGSLRAGTVAEDPSMRLLEGVERAVVESLVVEPRRGDNLRVGALQVRIGRTTRIDGAPDALRIDQRVRVTGVPDRRRGIAAERIEIPAAAQFRPEAIADRRPRPSAEQERERTATSDAERPERVERAELSRVERPEPARVERPEPVRVERPEPVRVERPEPVRVERPEPVRVDPVIRLERPRL